MLRRLAIGAGLLFSLLLLYVAAAIVWMTTFGQISTGGTLASGRSVSASADSFTISMEYQADTATIRTLTRTVVVAPTSLHVNGHRVGSLDAAAKTVAVNIEDGKVAFIVDGKPLGRQRR